MFGRELAAAGLVVVSGMARGVDGEAHRGALEAGGSTVAVLGCGVDRDYPAAHADLARRICEDGLVVSEYPPGVEPAPWRFPARNRIVAGLAQATIVVEARERSGALITADLALEEGREVFAVPGEITSALSAGTNALLRVGATAATSVLDFWRPSVSLPPSRPLRSWAPLPRPCSAASATARRRPTSSCARSDSTPARLRRRSPSSSCTDSLRKPQGSSGPACHDQAQPMRRTAALAALVALVLSLPAEGAPGPAVKIKNTKDWIEALAMDGSWLAYDVRGSTACNKLFVWNVQTGAGAVVSGKATCDADGTSTGAGVREIAIAGPRIAWIVNQGGNTESDDYLYTASLPKPKEKLLAGGVRTGDIDGGLAGDGISGLVGGGDRLAVNRWTTDAQTPSPRARCSASTAG